jgi:hypothetical protein
MSAQRFIIRAAVATVGCVAAFANPAQAKFDAIAGSMIAYDRGGDIRAMSDAGVAVFDVDVTQSVGEHDSAPSWGLPDDNCLRDPGSGEVNLAGGRTLVYESRAGAGDSDVVLAKLRGYPPVLQSTVDLTPEGTADEGAPAVGAVFDAADNALHEAVVFTRGPVGHRDVWAKFLDGTHETQLTSEPGDESAPDWSSDGRGVVYETADDAGRQQLALVRVGYDSTAEHDPGVVVLEPPRFITAGADSHGAPSWFGSGAVPEPGTDPPTDSSRIVHVVGAYGTTYLDFVEAFPTTTGSLFAPASVPPPLRYELTGEPGGDLRPSWQPHGADVAFDSDRAQPGNRDVYRVSGDAGAPRRLTTDPAADEAPDWEPNGFGCLTPAPYDPRPGTQSRGPKSPSTGGQSTGDPQAGAQPPATRPADTQPPAAHGSSGNRKRTPPPLRISGLRVTSVGNGAHRVVTARFVLNSAARGSLRLLRGRRAVARTGDRRLPAGRASIRLNVPRSVRGGPYRLRLTVRAGSTTRKIQRDVRVSALPRRR